MTRSLEAAPLPTWASIIPIIPLTSAVPFIHPSELALDPCILSRHVCCYVNDRGHPVAEDGRQYNSGVMRVDLDHPQGFAYAYRHLIKGLASRPHLLRCCFLFTTQAVLEAWDALAHLRARMETDTSTATDRVTLAHALVRLAALPEPTAPAGDTAP